MYSLHQRLNLYKFLESQGITPSYNKEYSTRSFLNAIRTGLNVNNIYMKCNRGRNSHTPMIEEVRICLNLSYNPINCYKNNVIGCGEK